MRKLFILIYKDTLLLLKDKAGLLLLFLMPIALVFIMTLLQDNTYRSIHENRIPLIILNNDRDSLGLLVIKELQASKIFNVTVASKDKYSVKQIREQVSAGHFQLGIIIPDSATAKIKLSIKRAVALAFAGLPKPKTSSADSLHISILIDPTTKSSFKATIMSNLHEFTGRIEYQITINEINRELQRKLMSSDMDVRPDRIISYKEEYALSENNTILPNSVQHNVPAWTLFALFFIVISLSTNMIKEREEGSFNRLLTMPCSYTTYIFSKMLTYLIVCILLFFLMMLMGVYILPLAGLPQLNTGINFFALGLIVIASSLAAISFGIAIGSLAASHQQAANFGSVSVVILAAIGGIWVPVFAMPPLLRSISVISPMNWGLDGFYNVFIRNQNSSAVLVPSLKLIVFAFICLISGISYFNYNQRKK